MTRSLGVGCSRGVAMSICKDCGEFPLYAGQHVCPPKWTVWREDEAEEDGRNVHARDEELAVEKWAEEEDSYSAEYSIVGGHERPKVFVRLTGSAADPKRYVVSGEAVPSYYAKEAPR